MAKKIKVVDPNKVKGFVHGFKEFITKGNVVDLAVGVIIGGAFGKIITSLVNDIILPPIGVLLGGVDFKDLKFNIAQAVINGVPQFDADNNPIYVSINYGNFIQVIIEFLIIAFSIYLLLHFLIKGRKLAEKLAAEAALKLASEKLEAEEKVEAQKQEQPPVVPEDIKLLTEIRDLLKK